MLDFSLIRQISQAEHWSDEINQLYHPTGEFKQDSQNIVYTRDTLNTNKFVPVLLKEWFYLVKKNGFLIIDYQPNTYCDWKKLEENMWWLWKNKYEIIYHAPISSKDLNNLTESKLEKFVQDSASYNSINLDKKTLLPKPLPTLTHPESPEGYLRFVCQKTGSTQIADDQITKWTFGIITNGKRLDWMDMIVDSIRKQKIPNYEIVVCGAYFDRKEANFKYIPFNQRDNLGWITKKKNLIVQTAQYENICIIHDRIVFGDNWYKGMKKWGNCFDHLGCVQTMDNQRVADWLIHEKLRGQEFGFATLLDYRDWDFDIFQSGTLHILKKTRALETPWDETFLWANHRPEDLQLSNQLRDRGHILRFNPYSDFQVLTSRFVEIPSVSYNAYKLDSARVGYQKKQLARQIYKYIYHNNTLRNLSFKTAKILKV